MKFNVQGKRVFILAIECISLAIFYKLCALKVLTFFTFFVGVEEDANETYKICPKKGSTQGKLNIWVQGPKDRYLIYQINLLR